MEENKDVVSPGSRSLYSDAYVARVTSGKTLRTSMLILQELRRQTEILTCIARKLTFSIDDPNTFREPGEVIPTPLVYNEDE